MKKLIRFLTIFDLIFNKILNKNNQLKFDYNVKFLIKYTNLQLKGLNLRDSTISLDDNLILNSSFQFFKPLTDIFAKIEKKEEEDAMDF